MAFFQLIQWISQIVKRGDTREFPYFVSDFFYLFLQMFYKLFKYVPNIFESMVHPLSRISCTPTSGVSLHLI